jgi:hypothetical protein
VCVCVCVRARARVHGMSNILYAYNLSLSVIVSYGKNSVPDVWSGIFKLHESCPLYLYPRRNDVCVCVHV